MGRVGSAERTMGLRDIGAALPPGFRFYPSDEELVCHYLFKKIVDEEAHKGTLVEIDLHTCEPWQLPGISSLLARITYTRLSSLFSDIVIGCRHISVRPSLLVQSSRSERVSRLPLICLLPLQVPKIFIFFGLFDDPI